MAGGIESAIPGLPIDHAADTLLQVNPTLGAVIIFEAAAICALCWFIARLIQSGRADLAAAKAEHTADLKVIIPVMQDVKELMRDQRQGVPPPTPHRRRTT